MTAGSAAAPKPSKRCVPQYRQYRARTDAWQCLDALRIANLARTRMASRRPNGAAPYREAQATRRILAGAPRLQSGDQIAIGKAIVRRQSAYSALWTIPLSVSAQLDSSSTIAARHCRACSPPSRDRQYTERRFFRCLSCTIATRAAWRSRAL